MFKYFVEGICMTIVSIFGFVCNFVSIYILHDKDVKLKKDFVQPLCAMAIYDNLVLICVIFHFSLPELSAQFKNSKLPYILPYLHPILNTLKTCSSYMIVVVAVNRCLGTVSKNSIRTIPRIKNGYLQAFIVLVISACVNAPRWMELSCCNYHTVISNITDKSTGNVSTINSTVVLPIINPIMNNYRYIRDYTLIASNCCTLLFPMIVMSISAILIYQEMAKTSNFLEKSGAVSDSEEETRRRRYRSVTLMLIGIIALFIVCRVGELGISIYELVMMVKYGDRFPEYIPEYIWAINSINNLLLVCDSSLNVVIYYKDLLFRQCLLRLTGPVTSCKKKGSPNVPEGLPLLKN